MTNATINYYDDHATEFCKQTLPLDTSSLCLKFMSYLPRYSHILDVGCDSAFFTKFDHYVQAMDASAQIVIAASQLTGIAVTH